MAALQLFEKGYFLMTDPVYEYLPEFKEMYIQKKGEDNNKELVKARNYIKVQDLFTMTAGLTYDMNTPFIRYEKERTQGRCSTRRSLKQLPNPFII